MVFRSPKYYAELRKFRREQERRDQARKLTSYKLPGPRPISNANKGLIHRKKFTSSQASGSKPSSLPSKAQASSPSPQAPGSGSQGTSVPSPCPGNKQQE